MKTIVLAILLACAVAAGAQATSQTAPPTQPAAQGAASGGGSESAPTIKDPAEYNAYVNAAQQKDNNAKISGLEAFLTQYPNSVMKTTALEQLMAAYQQTGDQAKVVDTAKRVLTADPCNLRALALLTFLARQNFSSGQNAQQNLADLGQYAGKGIECAQSAPKPAVSSQADYDNLKKTVTPIFQAGKGFADLQNKDFASAQTHLKAAVDANPNDLQNVYPLAMAYLSANPPDTLNGLFYIARAANLAPTGTPAQQQIQTYGQRVYKNYHGSTDGWADYAMATAKTETAPPADWATKITKYTPPTPAQQAHDIVNGKTPDQIAQLTFGDWELVLSAGTPEDQDKVWSVIKGKPLQMVGTVLAVPSNTELHIAASADDIEAKREDITLTMTGPIPAVKMPKVGDDAFAFEGVPASYTATPFMMQMTDGKLLRKPGAAAPKKAPVRRRPATTRKPASGQ